MNNFIQGLAQLLLLKDQSKLVPTRCFPGMWCQNTEALLFYPFADLIPVTAPQSHPLTISSFLTGFMELFIWEIRLNQVVASAFYFRTRWRQVLVKISAHVISEELRAVQELAVWRILTLTSESWLDLLFSHTKQRELTFLLGEHFILSGSSFSAQNGTSVHWSI